MKSDNKSKRFLFLAIWLLIIAIIIVGIVAFWPPGAKHETIKETMQDGVLHEHNRISLFGLEVNPALISAYIVTAVLLIAAALIRIFAIPKFKLIPGKFQSIIEKLVEFFSDMANNNSHHKPKFIGAYIFGAGVYIFFSTIFELFGIQAVTTDGASISLPAPISDINAAIALGVLSYAIILGAGIRFGGLRGALGVLKDFSLPISMSFRLFGALLSGLLVTELVYYYVGLSFVLPVIVAVLFTLLHALIQTYVLATLVSIFYGEAVEPKPKKVKVKKKEVI
ncbi:MAG: F0F1 ATP synthase subunit A [Clostridia bacterium]|nr:F0F1 ATP synthase subunit A [Clostridia bacterium]